MFDCWKTVVVEGKEVNGCYVDEDYWEELMLNDPLTRDRIKKIFNELLEDFDYEMQKSGIYLYFQDQNYKKIKVDKNDYVLFIK